MCPEQVGPKVTEKKRSSDFHILSPPPYWVVWIRLGFHKVKHINSFWFFVWSGSSVYNPRTVTELHAQGRKKRRLIFTDFLRKIMSWLRDNRDFFKFEVDSIEKRLNVLQWSKNKLLQWLYSSLYNKKKKVGHKKVTNLQYLTNIILKR